MPTTRWPGPVTALGTPYLQVLAFALVLDAFNANMASVMRAHLRTRDAMFNILAMHSVHLLLCLPMMRGVPVLTSNRSALPEVSGDAARLVNPLDTDAIAEGLRTLIGDETLRMSLVRKGLEHASQFTWEKALERTWQVYGELFA